MLCLALSLVLLAVRSQSHKKKEKKKKSTRERELSYFPAVEVHSEGRGYKILPLVLSLRFK